MEHVVTDLEGERCVAICDDVQYFQECGCHEYWLPVGSGAQDGS